MTSPPFILEMAVSRGDSRAAPSYVDLMGNLDVPLSPVHRLHVLGFDSSDGLEVNWTQCFTGLTLPCLSVGPHTLHVLVTGPGSRVTGTLVLVYEEVTP